MESIDLEQLQERVKKELDEYVYYCPPGTVGRPLSDEYVQKLLNGMRKALVSPYWIEVEIRDTWEQCEMNDSLRQESVVVANNKNGYLLVFDPVANEFMLVTGDEETGYATLNIRGDAVGCFMSI